MIALLSEEQAAQALGISVRTLQRWRVEGGGPPYTKLGRAVRYPERELDRHVERQLRRSTSDRGPDAPRG